MKIELTADEEKLASEIEFDPGKIKGHEEWRKNSEIAYNLARSLLLRKAVPDHRLRFFNENPSYHPGGRNKSRRDYWHANGNNDAEILRHNNFLPFLRYFIHGPDLPTSLVSEYRTRVDDCGMVTSGDIVPLSKFARDLWRRTGKQHEAEKFFQLALECGLSASRAASIYDAVKKAR